MKQFFATEVAAGTFKGQPYAIPWFDNPEGLFYRTDLIKTPPKTPQEVVSDAKAAMKADKPLKEGLAFEGDKYEGAITAFLTVDAPFGGKLTQSQVNTKGNVAALQWLHDAIYKYKIAPQAVTGWQEGQVQQEFTAGHAAFAINAKSQNVAAAWKLIQYLTSSSVEVARAEATGDPPSLPAAYTSALYAKAPYFKQVKTLNGFAQPRPVSPQYLQISVDLQNALSSVFSNISQPSSALSSAASQISSLPSS